MKIQLLAAGVLTLCLSLGLTGCSGNKVQAADISLSEVSIREAVTQATPQDAVDQIYGELPDVQFQPLGIAKARTLFPELSAEVDSCYGGISDANSGLADLMIIAPVEGQREAVRTALLSYQDARIKEFEDYDILDAFEIAKAALVYDQGDYVILTMLPDNEMARDIIDLHIPL